MKKIIISSLIIFTFLLSSCFEHDSVISPEIKKYSVKLNDSIVVQLSYKQEILLDDNIAITFDDVAADSRCPLYAICVWAGDGEVKLSISKDDVITQTSLHTTLEPKSAVVFDYVIKLNSLMPYPEIDKEIKKEDYKIELIIKRI
ncbi:MAG: hypothetical protein QHH13_04605 [Melioribacter sp.]|uniref:hypothetical protein n=1 Tax=Rosettibacter primus TaxID=3111523 RepID=UPI00247D0408|nr:hypothetical protein [Melioribacter sp.]